jgi:hypothetical protein
MTLAARPICIMSLDVPVAVTARLFTFERPNEVASFDATARSRAITGLGQIWLPEFRSPIASRVATPHPSND